jgi:hypothetical protein
MEMEGDAGWDEWNRAVQQEEVSFAATAPMSLEFPATQPAALSPTKPVPLPPPAKSCGGEVTLDAVMQEARRNNRICPKPEKWMSMYALLAVHGKGAALPPAPLTGAVWDHTPAMPKRLCFIEHIEWAAANGCLPAVHAFLKSLADGDWHYAG